MSIDILPKLCNVYFRVTRPTVLNTLCLKACTIAIVDVAAGSSLTFHMQAAKNMTVNNVFIGVGSIYVCVELRQLAVFSR